MEYSEDIKRFVVNWVNSDVLNEPYKLFEVYISDCYSKNVNYYISPNKLLDKKYVSIVDCMHIVICNDIISYQEKINQLVLEPHEFTRKYYTNVAYKWGYEHKYCTAAENMKILFCERFNVENFKLIWLLLLINDLKKISFVFLVGDVTTYEIMDYISNILSQKNITMPYLHLETKHQFFDNFNNKAKYKFDNLQDLLNSLYDYTYKWLVNNRIAILELGTL